MDFKGGASGGLELYYDMNHAERGQCVIFYVEGPEQSSCKKDARNIKSAFQYLGFNCTVHSNPTATRIREILTDVSASRDHTWSDCFVCLLLAPGKNGDLVLSQGEKVTTEAFTKYFLSSACGGLKDKPKLFFVQVYEDSEEATAANVSLYDMTIPNEYDFFLAYDVISRSNPGRKPNLVQAVDSLLRDTVAPYQTVDLQDIMRKAARMTSRTSTTSCYMSTLKKRVVFSVKRLVI